MCYKPHTKGKRMLLPGVIEYLGARNWAAVAMACAAFTVGCNSVAPSPPGAVRETDPILGDVTHRPSQTFLRQMVREERFSGAVLVARNGDVIHARAYGMATEDEPNRLDTVFHVGSLTKQFTAAAIMQQVERGLIDLESSVNSYLPKSYRSPIWDSVQVRHLLSHTSGVPDYAIERDYYDMTDGWPTAETVQGMIVEAMSTDLHFEPGTAFRYSNLGYTLLGEILEETTGEPFADYIERNLLEPIGMTRSRIHGYDYVETAGEARGHRWDAAAKRYVKDDNASLPVTAPDGGLITTLNDFQKWIETYLSGRHPQLSADSTERLMRPAIPAGTYDAPGEGLRGPPSYGFGLTLSGDLLMHSGYIVGFKSYFIYARRSDLLIVVFTNNVTNDPVRIAQGLFAIHAPTQVE